MHNVYYRIENSDPKISHIYPNIPVDSGWVGWLPVTKSLDELFLLIDHEKICKLQKLGYTIHVYFAISAKRVNDSWLIKSDKSEIINKITLLA